jgi:sec-independent protein translocase protein TatA
MEIFSPGHLIPLLIVAAILFFGWKQLPDMAKSVGKSLRIFKTEMKGMSDDDAAREAHKTETIEQAPVPPSDPPDTPSQGKPTTD